MNKKLILLILLLPLIMMFSIYTSTSSVSLNVAVGVSKIEVIGSKYVYLDLDKNEHYFVNYAIYPVSATNKEVKFESVPVGSEKFASLKYEDGYIIPETPGVAKVTLTTVDGGFKDSFIVKVEETNLQSISCVISQNDILAGNTAKITTTFTPENHSNKLLTYSSSNTKIATVNNKGVVTGLREGSATITITSCSNPSLFKTIEVNVYEEGELNVVGGGDLYALESSGSVELSVSKTEEPQITYEVYTENGVLCEKSDVFNISETGVDEIEGEYVFNYTFLDDFIGTVKLVFKMTTENSISNPVYAECYLHKMNEITATFDSEVIVMEVGDLVGLHLEITLNPENADVSYSVKTNSFNENLLEVQTYSQSVVKAIKPGITDLVLVITNNENGQSIEKSVKILVYSELNIDQATTEFGYEGLWTVGGLEADGSENSSKLTLSSRMVNEDYDANEENSKEFISIEDILNEESEIDDGFVNNIKFISNNENVSVTNDGTINNGRINILNKDFVGNVQITCVFEYNGVVYKESAPIEIRCVGNGVNVRNFAQLLDATQQKKVVVVQNEIVDDFGVINGENYYNEQTVTKIQSTYDTAYYENVNKLIKESSDANKKYLESTVKVLINFKEDVYGNGFEINAGNVTYKLDSTGGLKSDALFKGPLKFVSLSDSASSSISVNAQDNICFAVYENVNLVNVNLKGCDLEAGDNGYDLTDLTYVGTTVEVLGDNVSIKYSNISNGRTVLRVFGAVKEDVNDSSKIINDSLKVINVNISNSVLSCAREFIIRMGSNCFLDGTLETPAPYLNNDSSVSFPVQKTYKQMSDEEKEAYEEKFIKTYVTLKNSVLKDSGLFCIGIDSHFSGLLLENGLIAETWTNLARTSYGAKLIIEGDVRMYDWKNINSVNSDTLIETNSSTFEKYKLDVKELINSLATNTEKPNLNKIVYNKEEKDGSVSKYVHGGIAFFGGGKNYGVAEFKDYKFAVLNGYEINLSDVGRTDLQAAAGNESFYFLLNDASIANQSTGFLPENQEELLKSEEAYAPIYIKD